ncbi:amidase [Rhizobium oryzicola]|uniref:Amidase n=1 Tax=Rhizobium oryzicola TaxID=1232668 RepID=A0ABT8SXY9_9HYPH|nr:amidase [Rhizobium oryzicola]MDO1583288.1 amidase [Rhizobium oryzicola]
MPSHMTIRNAATELGAGTMTSTKLTESVLERINDPAGEGLKVYVRRNDQRARQLAEASDRVQAAGHRRSLLEGLPISVKDLFDISGETTLAGSVALKDRAPAATDSPVVRRLIAAGAVITGTTNMSEFAFSGLGLNPHYGTPRNPYEREKGRVPGGSSSGAAISVTDGMAVAAIGTDTGGSIRIPSALCGLTGFKPTARRVSAEGVVPLSTTLDSIGPLARSVSCCAVVDAVLTGDDAPLPTALPIRGLRLGVVRTVVQDDMDTPVAKSFDRALSLLSAAGAVITEIDIPEFAELSQIYARTGFVAAEAFHWHQDLIAEKGHLYDHRVRARIERGREISSALYIEALHTRRSWQERVGERVAGFDAIVMPTVPIIAPEIAPLEADDAAFFAANALVLRNPTMINFLDGCALSLPCHTPGEAPVGLMLAGTAMQDRHILRVGLAVEEVLSSI